VNEEALAHWGLLRQKEKAFVLMTTLLLKHYIS
jgi:hypothetical protein